MAEQTFYNNATPSAIEGTDGIYYNMGFVFTVARAGVVKGIKYRRQANEPAVTHKGQLWRQDNQQLLGEVIFTNESSSGWQEARFSTPISVAQGVVYVAAVNVGSATASGWYMALVDYFSSAITVGDIAGIAGANNTFTQTVDALPTSSFRSSSYFRDVIFEALPNEVKLQSNLVQPITTGANLKIAVRLQSNLNQSIAVNSALKTAIKLNSNLAQAIIANAALRLANKLQSNLVQPITTGATLRTVTAIKLTSVLTQQVITESVLRLANKLQSSLNQAITTGAILRVATPVRLSSSLAQIIITSAVLKVDIKLKAFITQVVIVQANLKGGQLGAPDIKLHIIADDKAYYSQANQIVIKITPPKKLTIFPI